MSNLQLFVNNLKLFWIYKRICQTLQRRKNVLWFNNCFLLKQSQSLLIDHSYQG